MATLYSMPDTDDVNLLNRVLADWHKDLAGVQARVQILFASSDPAEENPKPPVKHGGYPARATIRVVPTKDRLTKGYDAEMLVDHDWWQGASEKRRVALLDHELSHLAIVTRTTKARKGLPAETIVALDDLGRPKLKLVPGDWSAGDGFAEVIARHGDDASEFENLRTCWKWAEKAKNGELMPEAA